MRAGLRVDQLRSFSAWARVPMTRRIIPRSKYACGTLARSLPANLQVQTISTDNLPAVPHRRTAALITLEADSQVGVGIAGSRDTFDLAGSPSDLCKQLPPAMTSSEEFWSLKLARSGSTVTSKWGETGIIMPKKPAKPQSDQRRVLKMTEEFQRGVL